MTLWTHQLWTKRKAKIGKWSGVAKDDDVAKVEASLMLEIAWTAMVGPKGPPLPAILKGEGHVDDARHPAGTPGWIHERLDWELDSAYSRQLEKVDYGTFAPPIKKDQVVSLTEAVVRSDPYLADALREGAQVYAYLEDRAFKKPQIRNGTHPYCMRIRAELTMRDVASASSRVIRARCHPTTLTAMMAIAACNENDPDRQFYGYYHGGEVENPNSATLRAIMGIGQEQRTADAIGFFEERGFPKLADALRSRTA